MVENIDDIEEKLKNSFQAMKVDVLALKESMEKKLSVHSDNVKDAFSRVKQDIGLVENDLVTTRKRLDHRDDLRETIHDIRQLKLDLEKVRRAYVQKDELADDMEKVLKLIQNLDENTIRKVEIYKNFDRVDGVISKIKESDVDRLTRDKLDVREFDKYVGRVERELDRKAPIKDVNKFMKMVEKGKMVRSERMKPVKVRQEKFKSAPKVKTAKVTKQARLGKKVDKEPISVTNLIANILLMFAFISLIGSIVTFFINKLGIMDWFLIVGIALLVIAIIMKVIFIVSRRE